MTRTVVAFSGLASSDQRWKCSLALEVLRRFGELRLRVTGGSMLPSLWPGDVLVIRSAQASACSCGDLVLFRREERFFVHRVLDVSSTGVLTRGDSLPAPDPLVTTDELLGRVISVSRNGTEQPLPTPVRFGRLIAWGVCRSTVFYNLLLRLRAAYQRRPWRPAPTTALF